MKRIRRGAFSSVLSAAILAVASIASAVTIAPGDLIIRKGGGSVVHLDAVTSVETTLYSSPFLGFDSPVVVTEDGGVVVLEEVGGQQLIHVDALTGVANLLEFIGYVVPRQFSVDRSRPAFRSDGDEDLLLALGYTFASSHQIWRITAPSQSSVIVDLLDENSPSGVAAEADGQMVAAGRTKPGLVPVVLRVDPENPATPTTLASGAPLSSPWTIDVESDGRLIIADSSEVLRVDPTTGTKTSVKTGTYTDAIVDRENGDLILNSVSEVSRYDPVTASSTTILSEVDPLRRIALVQPWLLIADPADDPSGLRLLGGSETVGGLNVTFDATDGGALSVRHETATFAEINDLIVNPELSRPGFAIAGTDFQIWFIEFTGVINGQAVFVFGYDETLLGSVPESEIIVWQYFDDQGWVDVPAANVSIDTVTNRITVMMDVIATTALGTDGACSDGIDNDGDSKIDFGTGPGNDPGCESATDLSEHTPAIVCDDGIDNDHDGRMDFHFATFNNPGDQNNLPDGVGDPACLSWDYPFENRTCSDGIDNDPGQANGLDYDGGYSAGLPAGGTPDPKCTNPWQDEVGFRCGLGFELGLLLPFWRRVAGRRRQGLRLG